MVQGVQVCLCIEQLASIFCPATQEQEVRKSQTHLIQEQQLTASQEGTITELSTAQRQTASDLAATRSEVQELQANLQLIQQQYQSLEQEHSALQSDASTTNATLASVQSQLSDTERHLADSEEIAASLKSLYEVTDQDKTEAQKQLTDARTGIRNLRNRLDESESELKKTRVQSSLQVCLQFTPLHAC